jgi:hypothetical protein
LDNYFRVLAHHKFQDKNDPDRFITFIEKFSNHFYHCAQAGCADGDAFWAMLWNFQDHMLGAHENCSEACTHQTNPLHTNTQYMKEDKEMMKKLICHPHLTEKQASCYIGNHFTSSVESFNHFLAKYCTKDGNMWKAELGRTLCAVLDWNAREDHVMEACWGEGASSVADGGEGVTKDAILKYRAGWREELYNGIMEGEKLW